jgi:MarR family transcriptional regulator, organic hydroperoxide resistance regulator
MKTDSELINDYWTDIYYHLHYPHKEKITHQVIRILQHVQKQENVGINEIASYLDISQNTASDHIKRIIKKGFLLKSRDPSDERRVILCLTSEGREIVYSNTSLDEEKLDDIFLNLSEEEKKTILKSFKILSERAKKCM